MASKRNSKKGQKKETPTWEKAYQRVRNGPLSLLSWHTTLHCDKSYPMGRDDWAYVTSSGGIFLNPAKMADEREWYYIITHCLLHLGLDHFQADQRANPVWNTACDIVVESYLRAGSFGPVPYAFQIPLSISTVDEEQALDYLISNDNQIRASDYSTMKGRSDMVWDGKPRSDFSMLFAESLQNTMRNTIRKAAGLDEDTSGTRKSTVYGRARDWFISSYPLLGALAASFKLVDDSNVTSRMQIPVAAVNPQMSEIYINPYSNLTESEWKFVLAHEFLHAALRHDARCEDRIPELWNVACDFVINGWLVDMNIGTMPQWALFDNDFKNLSAEALYDQFVQDVRYYSGLDPKDIVFGDADWWEATDGVEMDRFYRSALAQGLSFHQQQKRGYLPSGFVEEIYALARPPIPWDVQLAKWFDERFRPMEKRRTYSRASRRQSSTPKIPRPAWQSQEEYVESRIFGVLLDTSGSMDRPTLAAALGTVASYSVSRDVEHVRVVFCDAVAYDQGIMHPNDIAGCVKIRGRGGTILQPGIDILDSDASFPKDAPLLVITDGECDRLNFQGRDHAFLIPYGCKLPFSPKGPVFKLK